MPVFELHIQLFPPRLFGLPDGSWLIAPVGVSAFVNFSLEPGGAIKLENQFREDDQRLTATFRMNGMGIEIDDNKARIVLEANSLQDAFAYFVPQLQLYCSLVTTFVAPGGHPVTFQIVEAFADGEPVLLPQGFKVPGLFYNLDENRRHFETAAELADGLPADPVLEQALNYFTAGDEIHNLVTEKGAHHLWPLCFLQFWKALASIVGDPSRDSRDCQSRFRMYGLGAGNRAYYEQVLKPLHDMRNQFDVAHVASLDAPLFTSEEDVVRCRRTAAEAIQAYTTWRKASALAA
jgi:hypothetical protein